MGKRPRSERKLSTFGELKEIPSLNDKIKVGERKGERGSRGPSCAGGFSYTRNLGLTLRVTETHWKVFGRKVT